MERVDTPAWHALGAEEVLFALKSDARGLSAAEARSRLVAGGPNALPRAKREGAAKVLWRQIDNPIVYLLLGSTALAILLGKVTDGAVVFGAVVVNTLLGFVQEYRAGKAIESLSQMVPHDAVVLRDQRQMTVSATELVPGDVVFLAAGDRVPADLRLLSTRNLHVEGAALTGESVPASKRAAPVAESAQLGDRQSMAFGGTMVTSGAGKAVVVATGANTELGKISSLLRETTELQTPLTRALNRVGRWLTVAVVAIAVGLLVVSLARGYPLADAVLVSVALAVAAIPEGLPAIVTIALAIGVQRMARRNAIIRKLPSVETLGSTTVVCTDKTGTLTRNEMTVQALWVAEREYAVTGVGYAPEGLLEVELGVPAALGPELEVLLRAGALCNDASLRRDVDRWKITGDPTEGALVVAAEKLGVQVDAVRSAWPRLDTIPFESEHQFMATLHQSPEGERVVFIKGAPEVVLQQCTLNPGFAAEVRERVEVLAARGLRVLAVATRALPGGRELLHPHEFCTELSFLGLQGMIDLPRPEAVEAIKACHDAGIVVKMITGDHPRTAEAIGHQLGLIDPGARGVAGAELEALDEDALRKVARETNVFARVAPEHKLKLVRALQREGHVVAMTGDGVNDSPALKQADIGVAMGINGTAVTKEASDMVLADDNFATIAAAVEEGRRIYDNLIKSLAFVLPTNLGLGLILIVSVVLFPVQRSAGAWEPLLPMLPGQLLWVNLVAAVALSLPLAFEVQERNVMRRPPRNPRAPILNRFVLERTALVAVFICAGAIGMFLWEYGHEAAEVGHRAALQEAQTMCITTVIASQIFYLFNSRSLKDASYRMGIFSNPTVFVGIGLLVALQAGFIYLPFMQGIFHTAPLEPEALLLCILVGAAILPVVGLEKRIRAGLSRRARPPDRGDLPPTPRRRSLANARERALWARRPAGSRWDATRR